MKITRRYEALSDVDVDLGISIIFAGYQQCEANHMFDRRRDHFVVHYVESGEGSVSINDRRYHLNSGDMFFIFPMQRNRYRASQVRPWKYRWIGFSGERAAALLASVGITADHPVLLRTTSDAINMGFQAIFELLTQRQAGYGLKATSIFLDVLWQFLERQRHTPVIVSHRIDYVSTTKRLIHSSYNRNVPIAEIATKLGVNRSYLSQIFRRSTGESIQEYLIGYRMERAKEHLSHTDLPIHAVAQAVGYSSYYSFAKRFRAVVGAAPSEYRDRNQAQTRLFFVDSD